MEKEKEYIVLDKMALLKLPYDVLDRLYNVLWQVEELAPNSITECNLNLNPKEIF